GRRAQLTRSSAPGAFEACSREAVVEELDPLELAAVDELADETRPRDLAALEPSRRLRIRRAAEHEAPELIDEVVPGGRLKWPRWPCTASASSSPAGPASSRPRQGGPSWPPTRC